MVKLNDEQLSILAQVIAKLWNVGDDFDQLPKLLVDDDEGRDLQDCVYRLSSDAEDLGVALAEFAEERGASTPKDEPPWWMVRVYGRRHAAWEIRMGSTAEANKARDKRIAEAKKDAADTLGFDGSCRA